MSLGVPPARDSGKCAPDLGLCSVEPRGLEPLTPCLQSRCATNCAKAPWAGRGRRGCGSGAVDAVGRLGPQRLLALPFVELPLGVQNAGGREGDEEDLLHCDSRPWVNQWA